MKLYQYTLSNPWYINLLGIPNFDLSYVIQMGGKFTKLYWFDKKNVNQYN